MSDTTSKAVICLKWGHKYSSSYVNILYKKIQQYSPNLDFFCVTDDTIGIDSRINIIPCISGVETWWNKLYVFSKEFPIKGTLLFLDLDIIITNDITPLFEYEIESSCIIQDFIRHQNPNWKRFNSSVFRIEHGSLDYIYTDFFLKKEKNLKKFRGDQDWIYGAAKDKFIYWPTEWILSYKWEIRQNKFLQTINDKKTFITQENNISIPLDNKIIVFHGDPKPDICIDKWVIENWAV